MPCRGNRKQDRRDHEHNRRPGRRARESRSRAPRPERRLAALAAKSRRQIAALAALQQHDRNQKKANDNVDNDDQNSHCTKLRPGSARFKIPTFLNDVQVFRRNQNDGAEGGI